MPTVQIGTFKRPGIFQKEFDNSVITSPVVQGIVNTVIGVSKKGPVNTPVLLNNLTDLQNIFGGIDTQLERNESFFHRTISNMLQSSPVYAINLLLTDDTLDQIQYQSVSCNTTIQNDIERLAPYRRFFNTTGFWTRDTDSFLDILDYPAPVSPDWNKRLLNFTNLSSNYVTVFVFKSQVTGFDVSLLQWYGAVEKIPPYVYSTDWASDYMVDVLIVAGDYSNYKSLSVDARFSAYFDVTGLRKGKVTNFSNDRNVTTLAYYTGLSMIPFFRDSNGNNIFIETVLNRDTDSSGIFCAFNTDLFETNFPTGLVDLVGNNLVGQDFLANAPVAYDYAPGDTTYESLDGNDGNNDGNVSIDFLSYNDKITESIQFTQTILDRPGNVVALFGTSSMPSMVNGTLGEQSHGRMSPHMVGAGVAGGVVQGDVYSSERTWWFSEGYVNDIYAFSLTASGATISIVYDVDNTSKNGYAVIGGNYVKITNTKLTNGTNGNISLSPTYYASSLTLTQSFYATVVVDSAGTIKPVQTNVAATTGTIASMTCFPLVAATDIVLGYASFSCYGGSFIPSSFTYNDVTIDSSISGSGDSTFKSLVYGVDFQYTITGSSSFTVTFLDTALSISPRDYVRYRRMKTFNNLLGYINSANSSHGLILLDPLKTLNGYSEKESLAYVKVSNITDTNTLNRSFSLNCNFAPLTNTSTNVVVDDDYVDNYFATVQDTTNIASANLPLVFYKVDDEFILGVNGVETKTKVANLSDMGVAGKYSNFYTNFVDGNIETEDVIYQQVNFSPVQVFFVTGASVTASLAGFDYVVVGVNNKEVDYLGNLNTDNIDANNSFFVSVDQYTPYSFLMTGVYNTGEFQTRGDEGMNHTTNPSYTPPFGFPSIPSGAIQRAQIIDTLAGGSFGFTSSATYSYYAFEVVQGLTNEFISSLPNIFSYNSGSGNTQQLPDAPVTLEMYLDSSLNLQAFFTDPTITSDQPFGTITGGSADVTALLANNMFFVKSFIGNFKETVQVEQPTNWVSVPNKILVRASRYSNIKVGDFLEAYFDETQLQSGEMPKKLTRVLSKSVWSGDSTLLVITCDAQIKITSYNGYLETTKYQEIDNYVSTYKAISLKGFRVRQASLPDGTDNTQTAILNLVASGTPLFNAITNKDAFDFRYLIDSFGLGLTSQSKQQLVDICGARLDCFGILNMPSMKTFKNSSSPSFIDANGVLQTSFIAAGGDPESSPAFLYSFGSGVGDTCVGYFAPYVTVNDNGRATSVPPSSYVGLTYMRKQNSTSTSIVPWTIAAGVTNGKVTNIAGLEMNFNDSDIENLNQAQMNPIVYVRNRGFVIDTENTAQTLYKSALSFIHVREVLIELERDLADMLLDFQWKFNTPEVRAEIKLRADVICETFVSKNGLYDYFNKCDQENNNSTIIDNQMGVLDTYVEPIKGMGIIVNNITILSTGAIQAGGFITS